MGHNVPQGIKAKNKVAFASPLPHVQIAADGKPNAK